MLSWEFIKQNWQSIFTILGAIGGIAIIIKFWSEKISPRLHRFYEWIKSKMPKLVRREELESIKGEVENLKNEINEVKFRPEIKAFSDEEKQKLSISCNPEFGYSFSPYFEFNFEIDNRFDQSFLLDRILYVVHAGDTRETLKYYICEDALLKRIMIKGNNKTTISKVSLVAKPDSINMINEKVTGGEHDVDWSINIEAFFEGREGLKLWSETIYAITKYNDWKSGNKRWD
jgi:hypothetical protein